MLSSTTLPSNDDTQLLSDANGISLEEKLDRFKMEESDVLPSDENEGTAGEKGGSSLNNNCDDDPNIQHEVSDGASRLTDSVCLVSHSRIEVRK
jgi:hypothetical protein